MNDDLVGLLLLLAVFWLIAFGFLGRYIAEQCGRSLVQGVVLGCFFGPLGQY